MSKMLMARCGPLVAILFSVGCGADPDVAEPPPEWVDEGVQVQPVPTFEEYRDRARKNAGGDPGFMVETDMLFETEEALRSYYNDVYVAPREKSIINAVAGVKDKRSNPTNIRYCFCAGWGQNQGAYTAPALATVQTNIQAGMRAWEGVADVRFVYLSNLDGASCTNTGANPGVDFVVQHYNSKSTAVGPFPSNTWANQKLKVPTGGISRLLAIHELGHTLGYRHEHIHSGASPQCSEGGVSGTDYVELTAFDTLSAMKYNNCTVSQVINGTEISVLDGVGARTIYGAPDWWWAVTPY